jgi:hypothetical protein
VVFNFNLFDLIHLKKKPGGVAEKVSGQRKNPGVP